MLISNRWQSKAALVMALGMTSTAAVPLLISAPAVADSPPYIVGQLFSQSSRVLLPAGSRIPVRYDEAERIIVTPRETASVTLTVAENIRYRGTTVIPAGSRIEGELRPASGGTQFFAKELIYRNGRRLPINARSQVITDTETITKGSNPNILRGAAIGAAAAAVLSEIFGSINLGTVLTGAGVGVLGELLLNRGRREVEVVVVDADTDLNLTLQKDLIRPR
jgi:hypothetical protein